MATSAEDQQPPKVQFPLDASAYQIINEIGAGVNVVVYKAVVVPMNHHLVAIKSIDLERSRTDIDEIRQESKTLSLLSHPNILNSHCSFIVSDRLWVVMPFMGGGSLQSIISHSFSDGLPEAFIAVVLKEILKALVYLHANGYVHRDVKAGNILVDSNGIVKLADFGVSASIYEPGLQRASPSSSSSTLMLTDFAGTPYWMAPEVIHSYSGYSFKADIWSFGITALELAHGRPPLSNIPPSKSLTLKITQRYRFSDFERHRSSNNKKFSKPFKDMVASCLNQDPSKRPTAEKLLKHTFFKNAKSSVLVRNMLHGLPSVEQRYRDSKARQNHSNEEDDEEGDSLRQNDKQRRVSGWNFNEEGLEFDPVFRYESESETRGKQVLCGSELFIQQPGEPSELQDEPSELQGEGSAPSASSGGAAAWAESQRYLLELTMTPERLAEQTVSQEIMLPSLRRLKGSLEEQLRKVKTLINMVHGDQVEVMDPLREMSIEINRLKERLEEEKEKSVMLQIEIEVLKLNISSGIPGANLEF